MRQHYGKQIRQEVLGEIMQKSYSDAVVQEKLRPAVARRSRPKDEDGKTFAYVATFEVLPEVELKDLDKIKVEKAEVRDRRRPISKTCCMSLRKQRATWEEVERKSKDGDRVVVDFTGTIDGEAFQGDQGRRSRSCSARDRCCRTSRRA